MDYRRYRFARIAAIATACSSHRDDWRVTELTASLGVVISSGPSGAVFLFYHFSV